MFDLLALNSQQMSPPGQRVDIGGYSLHLHCLGSGTPTVVMDSGLSRSSLYWSLVAPEIARQTRVCLIDRPGYGWSDRSPLARTSQNIAREIHAALNAAAIEPPYLLVGHSLGGLNAWCLAQMYPETVAGLVLVDAVTPGVYERMGDIFRQNMASVRELFSRLLFFSNLGLIPWGLQLLPQTAPPFVRQLPQSDRTTAIAQFTSSTWETAIAENDLMATGAAAARHHPLARSLPVMVLSHSRAMFSPLGEQIWREVHGEVASYFTRGQHQVVAESGHDIHLDRAQAVIAAIKEILTEEF